MQIWGYFLIIFYNAKGWQFRYKSMGYFELFFITTNMDNLDIKSEVTLYYFIMIEVGNFHKTE
jgi:hypothetical protein